MAKPQFYRPLASYFAMKAIDHIDFRIYVTFLSASSQITIGQIIAEYINVCSMDRY